MRCIADDMWGTYNFGSELLNLDILLGITAILRKVGHGRRDAVAIKRATDASCDAGGARRSGLECCDDEAGYDVFCAYKSAWREGKPFSIRRKQRDVCDCGTPKRTREHKFDRGNDVLGTGQQMKTELAQEGSSFLQGAAQI